MGNSNLEKLVIEERNVKLKAMLLNTNFSKLVDDSGMTLLHLAAKHGNVKLLRYLLSMGCDVNAKSVTGSTALEIAMFFNQLEAMQILLQSSADIFGADSEGTSIIEILMRKIEMLPGDVVSCIAENYKSNSLDRQTKAEIVVETRSCNLHSVMRLGDLLATAIFLRRADITVFQLNDVVEFLMKVGEEENVRTLLQLSSEDMQQNAFNLQCKKFFDARQPAGVKKLAGLLLERMMDWNIIDERSLGTLELMLLEADKEVVERFLNGHFDEYIRNKYGYETLVMLFNNRNVDAKELLKNRAFILHGKNSWGNSALHVAVRESLESNVRLLLDIGADPNVKNDIGMTPLSMICALMYYRDCGILLLQYGADIQFDPPTILSLEETLDDIPCWPDFAKAAVAQLALDHARGVPIGKAFHEKIISEYSSIFERCLEQIEEFKKHEIMDSLTLFAVLTAKPEDLVRRLRGEDCFSELEDYCEKRELQDFYDSTLKFKLDRASKMNVAKSNLAKIVSQKTEILVVFDHLIIEKIFSLLSFYDMMQLL